MKKLFIILCILLSCFSCSSIKITKVTDANRQNIEGVRFFLPVPYLMVAEKDLLVDGLKTVKENTKETITTTKKMAVARRELHCSVIYLPDPQQEYVLSTSSGNTPESFSLKDGWRLTGINLPESTQLTAGEVWLLSGTEGLAPGIYAIRYKDSQPFLKKVEILP